MKPDKRITVRLVRSALGIALVATGGSGTAGAQSCLAPWELDIYPDKGYVASGGTLTQMFTVTTTYTGGPFAIGNISITPLDGGSATPQFPPCATGTGTAMFSSMLTRPGPGPGTYQVSVSACTGSFCPPGCPAGCCPNSIIYTMGDSLRIGVDECLLEPVGPLPRLDGVSTCAASPVRCSSGGTFRVGCGVASNTCSGVAEFTATIASTNHDIVGGRCVETIEDIAVACDEIVELRLLAPPCPAKPPRSPRIGFSVNSAGRKVIFGEGLSVLDALSLSVTVTDKCGNVSDPCLFAPLQEPDPRNPGAPLLCPPRAAKCPVSACGARSR